MNEFKLLRTPDDFNPKKTAALSVKGLLFNIAQTNQSITKSTSMKKLMMIVAGLGLIGTMSSCNKCKSCDCTMTQSTTVAVSSTDGTSSTDTNTDDPRSLDFSNFCSDDEYVAQGGHIISDIDGENTWVTETVNTQVIFGETITTTTTSTTTLTCSCS